MRVSKNNQGTHQEWWGIMEPFLSHVGSMSLLNMTLFCIRVRLGTSHFVIFASMGLGYLFWPLIFSFPCHHDLRSLDVKYCQIPESCRQYVQEKLFLQFSPLILCLVLIHYHLIPLSHVDDVGNIMAFLRLVTSCRLRLIIQDADPENPFWYLRDFMPQWKFLCI